MLRSMNLKNLNPHITCVLCGGYLVDATTIIECLHSFCRSCIVRYLETSFHCPVCDVEIHKTRPLLHIRPDRVLQDIVYKLVPGLCHEEQKLRKKVKEEYKIEKTQNETAQADQGPSNQDDTSEEKSKQNDSLDIDDPICISLEYYGRKRYLRTAEQIFPTRYLRCSSQVTVGVLKKFLSLKFGIPPTHQPELVRSDEILDNHITMKELSRIYGLYTKSYLDLQYIFLTSKEDDELKSEGAKKIKIDHLQYMMVQPYQVKQKRRRRRKKQIPTEQQEEEQPKKKRRRRRKQSKDVRTNIRNIQDDQLQAVAPAELNPNEQQEYKEDLDFAFSVPFEKVSKEQEQLCSGINHDLPVDDQREQDQQEPSQQKTELLKQPTERKDNEVHDQLNGQQYKENERNLQSHENINIRREFRAFTSVVKHTDDENKDKESFDLFKIPSLPPLRSRNLDRQVVNFTDSF